MSTGRQGSGSHHLARLWTTSYLEMKFPGQTSRGVSSYSSPLPLPSHSNLLSIKRLFSSSSLSAIRVISSAYLRILIFLPAILIPACASSSPVFLMMYSKYKLNKQGQYTALTYSFSYLEPVCCSISGSNCYFLTCIQISQEAGQVVWYSHLFKRCGIPFHISKQ